MNVNRRARSAKVKNLRKMIKKNNVKKTTTLKNIKNYVLITFCGLLAAVSVFLTIEMATSGAEVSKLDKTVN